LEDTIKDFQEIAQRVAEQNSTQVIFKNFEPRYFPMQTNIKLAEIFKEKAKFVGINMDLIPREIIGSMDMGNVSRVVPAIHPFIQLGKGNVLAHTLEFKKIAGTMDGAKTMKLATKALALTALELITKPQLISDIWQEHYANK
jgi:metal-dependent amidase/aminoacylase/carboxypeptidase family protein